MILNFVVILFIVLIFFAFFLLFSKRQKEELGIMREELKSLREGVLSHGIRATENLDRQLIEMRRDLQTGLKESRQSLASSTQLVHSQIESVTRNFTSLEEKLKNVKEGIEKVSSFQEIFRSPKLRGRWGEASLEYVLAMYFPKELYELQHEFQNRERVDALVKLPNGLFLPIDSKFILENFDKMIHEENEVQKLYFKKLFIEEIRAEIDKIASKYIVPSEGTVDFALMYIPAESIYYEVINNIKEVDLSSHARVKKVILISPNTFYLTLSVIQHWFRDVQIGKQTEDIIKRLGQLKKDSEKLGDDFRRLGKHLSDAKSSYDDFEKRVTLMIDRIGRLTEIGGKEAAQELAEGNDIFENTKGLE